MRKRPEVPVGERTAFLIEFMNLRDATGDPKAAWEPYQLRFLNQEATLTSDLKSRQVGWSFIAAADAVAHATLNPRSISIFVSMTRVEASEKVRYATYCLEALDKEVRPTLVIANRQELELENGSRIISHPCRPARGKARARVYLDEMAHYPNDDSIYTATVPVITRGGVIRIGSSPLGASGKFYEIHTEALQPYPGYVRGEIPWWACAHLCKDTRKALTEALGMTTRDLVYAYGKPRLIDIFENMYLGDFEQEYCLSWSDESVAWISWDEIKLNQKEDQAEQHIYYQALVTPTDPLSLTYEAVDALAKQIARGNVSTALYAGMDVGRKKNLSEVVLISEEPAPDGFIYPYRLGLSLDRMDFDNQFDVVSYALQKLPIERMLVDETGLGMALAERLTNTFPLQAEGMTFNNALKEAMAVEMKVRFQQARAPVPLDRDLTGQIHSIKKQVSPSKRVIFDTEGSSKHHADKFWGLALAHYASSQGSETISTGPSPLKGYRG